MHILLILLQANMEIKIDTKEKFTVVTPILPKLTAIIAAEIEAICSLQLQKEVKNMILNLTNVELVEELAAEAIMDLQQRFYENSASFVICCIQSSVENSFEKLEIIELLNITPTETEAWDIVQMEEIERELLDSDDVIFESKN